METVSFINLKGRMSYFVNATKISNPIELKLSRIILPCIISPYCISEHRPSKRYPKKSGFCLGIADFKNKEIF
jgi:hypothetical protein